MQKEPSISTECDPSIKAEQCIEDLVPEQDSDNVGLGVESNGDDNVAAATEGAVSGERGPDNAGLHTGSNDDGCVGTTDDAVPEQKDSDFVDQCMDSTNCDDHVAATGNGVSVDGAVLEPPDKKPKLEMGEQSRNAEEESWETLCNVEVPEVEGCSKVDGVHSVSSSVEQCDQKSSVEQGKDSDDSMGINALFIRGAEPVTVDYPHFAGRPSSSVEAEEQPPRSAPNDQCSVQSPVLFGGPKSYFSNFYPCRIHVFDRDFHSSEQAYQYRQAMFHGDSETAELIMRADDARAAKRESKHINKTNHGWEEKRVDVMREILKAKADVPEFREALLATGQAVLVENVPSWEGFWGLGNGSLGGENILGRLLMELRGHLITGMSEVQSGRVMYEEGRQQGNWGQRKSQRGSWEQGKSQRGSWEQGKSLNRRQHGMNENRRDDKHRTDHPRENNEKLDGRGQVESSQWASREQGQSHNGKQQGNKQRITENRSKGCRTDYPRDDNENLNGRRQYHVEERRNDAGCLGRTDRSTKRGQPSDREDSEHSQTREHPKVMACDKDHNSTEATVDPPCRVVCSVNDYPQDQSQAGHFYKKDEPEDEGSWQKVSKKKKGKGGRKKCE